MWVYFSVSVLASKHEGTPEIISVEIRNVHAYTLKLPLVCLPVSTFSAASCIYDLAVVLLKSSLFSFDVSGSLEIETTTFPIIGSGTLAMRTHSL